MCYKYYKKAIVLVWPSITDLIYNPEFQIQFFAKFSFSYATRIELKLAIFS